MYVYTNRSDSRRKAKSAIATSIVPADVILGLAEMRMNKTLNQVGPLLVSLHTHDNALLPSLLLTLFLPIYIYIECYRLSGRHMAGSTKSPLTGSYIPITAPHCCEANILKITMGIVGQRMKGTTKRKETKRWWVIFNHTLWIKKCKLVNNTTHNRLIQSTKLVSGFQTTSRSIWAISATSTIASVPREVTTSAWKMQKSYRS
jgi:hypothetical protein